jgi:AP-2 complex subunit alpha
MSQFVTYLIAVQENMTRMLMVTDVQDIIKRHQAQIITSLKDPDIRLCVLFYF